jgi:hypothetical protein
LNDERILSDAVRMAIADFAIMESWLNFSKSMVQRCLT